MYVDLHCHLLYDVDDGPRTPEESLAMARALVSLGFSAVAPSPHAGAAWADADTAARRLVELEQLLGEHGVALRLYPGAENALDADYLERELAGRGRHVAFSRYSLVELPYQSPVPRFADILFRLRRRGVRPVVAHPERCAQFADPQAAAEAVRAGALLQLDLGSLAGAHGKPVRKIAQRILADGLFAIAATDLHRPEQVDQWTRPALDELRRAAGDEGAERLLGAMPGRLLRDEEVE